MNLPALYASVCAKRPELAVEGLRRKGCDWYQGCMYESDRIAAALILARWVEALPAWFKLSKQDNSDHDDAINGVMWWVEDSIHDKHEGYAPTPLEALAAYYLGQ